MPVDLKTKMEALLRITDIGDYDDWESLSEELQDEFAESDIEQWGDELAELVEEWRASEQ